MRRLVAATVICAAAAALDIDPSVTADMKSRNESRSGDWW